MLVFGKKPKKSSEKGIPVDTVRNLASKGMSEQEIVSVLRKQGYSPYEIDRALSMALKSTVTGASSPQPQIQQAQVPQARAPEFPSGEQQKYRAQIQQFTPRNEEIPSVKAPEQVFLPKPQFHERDLPEFHTVSYTPQKEESRPLFTFEKSPFLPSPKEEKQEIGEGVEKTENIPLQTSEITLEEIIEGIVADKWTSFEDTVERLRKRDDELQKQIIDIRKEIDSIKDAMRKSEESFLAKLEEHSEQVASIEAKIGSIEKVFKEFLPELTESMRLITEALEKTKKSG